MTKSTAGVTLLELTIALAIWMLLSTGVFFLWQHTTTVTANTLTHQNALENARAAMDGLIMNIQMAHTITLETDASDILQALTMTQRNPQGQLHNYVMDFNVNALPGTPRYQVLRIGENEFASGLARIYIIYIPNRHMNITIQTACNEPIVLHGSVCARYKNVKVV